MYPVRLWSVRHARALQRIYRWFAARAPLLAPLLRWPGPERAEAILYPVERATKRFLFDCRECGECVLSLTGMACPMNCPKQMRNGPCGGVRPDGHCEVEPAMRCVWIEAEAGRRRIDGTVAAGPPPVLPAVDVRRHGHSTWIAAIRGQSEPIVPVVPAVTIRADRAVGPFESACRSGRCVVTVEIAPPDSANPADLLARAGMFKGLVDAINITDGAGGNCHMSSVAAAALLAAHGHVPVYQTVCRDRNRIAIQGDLLGAAALGVRNVLCLTGDDVSRGDQPEARPVFDLDAVTLLGIARGMCERGEFASGRRLLAAPDLFLGATVNPFVPPREDRIGNLEQKIAAGARFIQTQFCFDVPMFERFMAEVRRRGLHRRAFILAGAGTLGSARALRWMAANVPGVYVPEGLLSRIESAPDQKAEARRACIETARALAGIEGVTGVHLMGHRNEDVLAEVIVESGLAPRVGLA